MHTHTHCFEATTGILGITHRDLQASGVIVQDEGCLAVCSKMCLQLLEICELCIGWEACIFLVHVCVCGETPETLKLMEESPICPHDTPCPRLQIEREADAESNVPIGPDCRTERFKGTEFTMKWKHTKGFKTSTQGYKQREAEGEKSRASTEKQQSALNPVRCCKDEMASTASWEA